MDLKRFLIVNGIFIRGDNMIDNKMKEHILSNLKVKELVHYCELLNFVKCKMLRKMSENKNENKKLYKQYKKLKDEASECYEDLKICKLEDKEKLDKLLIKVIDIYYIKYKSFGFYMER